MGSNKESLGNLIRFYRKSRGMSQLQLAEAVGCSKSTIAMYETGKREPDMDQIEALADVFNIRIRDLVPERENSAHVNVSEWDPDSMAWAEKMDDTTRLLARGMAKMSPENRQKLYDVARLMFSEDFDEEGNKK